jgi:hypothetical protein
MTKILLPFFFMVFAGSVFGQALYKVENTAKKENSTQIVEGKVVDQVSFWNPAHTMIYTQNKVKIYKVFKGETTSDYIEVLTQGGSVGSDNISVSDLLELSIDDVGVLFCSPNVQNLRSTSGSQLYDVYGSAQGFVKYNVKGNKASDPFNRFSSITNELYPFIKNLTGRNYTVKDASLVIGSPEVIYNRTNAVITSFSPATVNAGASADPGTNVLTITGTGFGAPGGTAAVKFSDANSGIGSGVYVTVNYNSNKVLSWTDTQIKISVPSRAGTGTIIIRDAAGNETLPSFDILKVFYSILESNIGGIEKQLNLINANGQGGYTMLYADNMTPEANATYNRALQTWIELSGLNVTQGTTTGIKKAASDGNCVVFLDNVENGSPLPEGVLAACYTYSATCSPASANAFRRPEFDIIIRSDYSTGSVSFAYGPCPPGTSTIDLETVILHELGHAINLGHINDDQEGSGSTRNPPKLMNYAVANGVKRTSPDASAYQGSIYTCATNASINFGACTSVGSHVQRPVTRDSKDECPLTFPTSPTQQGTTVAFDLVHSTSNKEKDPQYTNVLCNAAGTNVTNNLYYVFRTDAAGSLAITVSDFTPYPAEASGCVGSAAPTVRIALYQVNTCPVGQEFPASMSCRSFNANGALSVINGLTANTNYLVYIDGRANSKATFNLTFGGTALPIKLESFAGEMKGPINELKWKIASFSDVSRLNLEKSSNGRDFTAIKQYGAALELGKDYLYNDNHPFAGSNYYRLATYNKDGSVQYSKVILLERKEKIKFNIFPNPVADNIKIAISSVQNIGTVQLKLFNSVGQLVLVKTSNVTNGTTNLEVKAAGLSAGTYRLVISDKNDTILESRNFQKL